MDKTIEQIKRAHQGDKTAREALVKDNLGLVWSIVRRFAGRGCETEDLFQIGSIGLLKAIDKFDLSYEVRFSTYAVPMIAGEIKRFLRDDGIIKVSRSIKEQNQRLRAAREALWRLGGSRRWKSWRRRLERAVRKLPHRWRRTVRLNRSLHQPAPGKKLAFCFRTGLLGRQRKMRFCLTGCFWEIY